MSEPTMPLEKQPHEELLLDLLEKLREVKTRADERAMATHERFNVFTTLLEPNDEVRLHTRFLHCLLNPKGSHDCGVLFLKLFFETLKERPILDGEDKQIQVNAPNPDGTWEAENESRIAGVGQIDILLKNSEWGIVIENKPNPDQHEDQIQRYADWLSGHFNLRHVFYLTRHGEQSKTHHGRPYLRISYADHILVWLEKCLRETHDIIPINQVLLQYRAVVRELIGITLDSNSMKEIVEFITENPDLIGYRDKIKRALDEASARLLKDFNTIIQEGLKPNYETSNDAGRPFDTHCHGTLIIQPPATSALTGAPFKICIQHWDEREWLYIGIVTDKKPSETQQPLYKEILEKLSAYGFTHAGRDDQWPIGWHYLIKPFDDAVIATIGKASFTATASKLITDIQNYIKALERAYKDARKGKHEPAL